MLWGKVISYWRTIGAGAVIAYLSLGRSVQTALPLFAGADKIVHCLMYMLLAATFIKDTASNAMSSAYRAILAIVLVSLYGGGMELLQQYYFPPRTGEWADWIADMIGGGIVAGIYLMMRHKHAE